MQKPFVLASVAMAHLLLLVKAHEEGASRATHMLRGLQSECLPRSCLSRHHSSRCSPWSSLCGSHHVLLSLALRTGLVVCDERLPGQYPTPPLPMTPTRAHAWQLPHLVGRPRRVLRAPPRPTRAGVCPWAIGPTPGASSTTARPSTARVSTADGAT